MSAEWLGDAHDHIARFSERGKDCEIADHAGDKAVIGVAGAKGCLEQLHAQGFDLVDVFRAGKPAIDLADVPFGGAGADFRRQQCPDGGTGGCLGCEQIDALFAPPFLVALHGSKHGVLHLLSGAARFEHGSRLGERFRIVDFNGGICNG